MLIVVTIFSQKECFNILNNMYNILIAPWSNIFLQHEYQRLCQTMYFYMNDEKVSGIEKTSLLLPDCTQSNSNNNVLRLWDFVFLNIFFKMNNCVFITFRLTTSQKRWETYKQILRKPKMLIIESPNTKTHFQQNWWVSKNFSSSIVRPSSPLFWHPLPTNHWSGMC